MKLPFWKIIALRDNSDICLIGLKVDRDGMAFADHLWMVVITILISLPIALVLGILAYKSRIFKSVSLAVFISIYTVTSLALFAFLIPFTGLGKTTAIVGLTIYSQLVLIRSFLTAMDAIPVGSVEAANAMGLRFMERVRNVDIPLALPYLLGGVRIAAISSTGIASIAALINAGGIGAILFEACGQCITLKLFAEFS